VPCLPSLPADRDFERPHLGIKMTVCLPCKPPPKDGWILRWNTPEKHPSWGKATRHGFATFKRKAWRLMPDRRELWCGCRMPDAWIIIGAGLTGESHA